MEDGWMMDMDELMDRWWVNGLVDECWVSSCMGGHMGEWVGEWMSNGGRYMVVMVVCIYIQSSILTYTDIPRYKIMQTHTIILCRSQMTCCLPSCLSTMLSSKGIQISLSCSPGTEVVLPRKGGNPAEHTPAAAPRTTTRSAQRPDPATCPASPSRGSASCQPGV